MCQCILIHIRFQFGGNDKYFDTLDINKALTRWNRDKFARAFARFFRVPLEGSSSSGDGILIAAWDIAGRPIVYSHMFFDRQ
jgi:hypothetical protein